MKSPVSPLVEEILSTPEGKASLLRILRGEGRSPEAIVLEKGGVKYRFVESSRPVVEKTARTKAPSVASPAR